MHLPSKTKTEHRAVNTLEAIIDEHLTMDHQFNGNDKEMSWDGYIWLYKNYSGASSKLDFDGKISVQIKGHNDLKHKFLGRDKIMYSVELGDLAAYATEKGVLYFQIFMHDKNREIFYASLYPSKIAYYLDTAKKKGNKSTYRIPFLKLEQDAEKLYILAKQFDIESKKQGSAYTPLVEDRIRKDDFRNLKSINLNVVGATDPYSTLMRISSGDVCLYGRTKDDKYLRPIEWMDNLKFFVGRNVQQMISIQGEVFYHQYQCIADSEGCVCLVLSPNLELTLTGSGVAKFHVSSSLKELSHDARFFLKLKSTGSFSIDGHGIEYVGAQLLPEAEKKLKYIVDLCETLEMIDFDVNVGLSHYTEEQQAQFMELVNLRLGAYDTIKGNYGRYIWTFGDKFVPILLHKVNNKIELYNFIYSNKIETTILCSEGDDKRQYRLPAFALEEIDVLSNLYSYNYEAFRHQIDTSDANEITSELLLECVLRLISVFDTNGDIHFLDLAALLLQKLEPFLSRERIRLNRLQIRRRQDKLTLT